MEIIAQLEKIIGSEKVKVDKDVLFAVARASDGALRDAESILDQLIAFAKDKVSLEDVVSILGMVEQSILFEITDKMISKDPGAALELLNGIIDNGKDANTFLADLIEHFRNLMVAKVSGENSRLIDLPEDSCRKLLEQANCLSMEEIFNGFSMLVNTQETAKRMESLRIPLEISLVRLCLAKPAAAVSAAQQSARQEKPQVRHPVPTRQEKPQTLPVKKEEPQPIVQKVPAGQRAVVWSPIAKPVENVSPVSFEQIKSLWQEIVQNTSTQKISIGNYLKEGTLAKLLGNVLTVSFHKNRSLYKESLEKLENRMMVEKIISQALKTELKVNFAFSQVDKMDAVAINHPSLQSAMDTFNARLIKEEPHG